MKPPIWRLLDTGYRSSNQNIALDKVLLLARSRGFIPDTLRFFQFTGACVLTGCYQVTEQEIRFDYCQQQGIAINCRITGGNAAYWDTSTIGFEVVISEKSPSIPKQLPQVTAKFGEALVSGLKKIGISANYKFPNTIEVAGRQIGWVGGTKYQDVIFYQGYIQVNDLNVQSLLRVLRIPTEKLKNKAVESFQKKITCLQAAAGKPVAAHEVKAALIDGFTQSFDISLMPGTLTTFEDDLYAAQLGAVALEPGLADQPRIPKPEQQGELRYMFKEEEVVIKVSLLIDQQQRSIQSVSIAGDFCAYPLDVISKLEAQLCCVTANPKTIRKLVQDCFKEHQAYIPGLTADHFSQAIIQALAKTAFTKLGVYPAEVNELCIVGERFYERSKDNLEQTAVPLLLPYCAKKLTCKLRYTQGCRQCGQCDIGKAYMLAKEYAMEPITIQNYEMLEETLQSLKQRGCQAFVGICCEAFWVKHRRDFERIGLPGILINVDNSTCYDLRQEQEAHEGSFENQTQLKLELIGRVLHKLRGDTRIMSEHNSRKYRNTKTQSR
jgi:lipoate-protein ligase A